MNEQWAKSLDMGWEIQWLRLMDSSMDSHLLEHSRKQEPSATEGRALVLGSGHFWTDWPSLKFAIKGLTGNQQ